MGVVYIFGKLTVPEKNINDENQNVVFQFSKKNHAVLLVFLSIRFNSLIHQFNIPDCYGFRGSPRNLPREAEIKRFCNEQS
ncbi:MAG: hypothetical protein D3908_11440 [Candidatus Electrothrix sp. AUS4]|nr:hypothetical protein [Candidatus Electrothrix sp. AUS4]